MKSLLLLISNRMVAPISATAMSCTVPCTGVPDPS